MNGLLPSEDAIAGLVTRSLYKIGLTLFNSITDAFLIAAPGIVLIAFMFHISTESKKPRNIIGGTYALTILVNLLKMFIH